VILLNPDYAVDTYCGLKNLVASQHIYEYAFGAKSLQLLVSLRFFNPRHDAYCIIWVESSVGCGVGRWLSCRAWSIPYETKWI